MQQRQTTYAVGAVTHNCMTIGVREVTFRGATRYRVSTIHRERFDTYEAAAARAGHRSPRHTSFSEAEKVLTTRNYVSVGTNVLQMSSGGYLYQIRRYEYYETRAAAEAAHEKFKGRSDAPLRRKSGLHARWFTRDTFEAAVRVLELYDVPRDAAASEKARAREKEDDGSWARGAWIEPNIYVREDGKYMVRVMPFHYEKLDEMRNALNVLFG